MFIVKRLYAALLVIGMLAVSAYARGDDEENLRNIETLIDQGRGSSALMQLEELIERHPKDPRVHFLKARAQEQSGQIEKAVAIYKRLLRDYPHLPEPLINLAAISVKNGQYEQARKLLLRALNTHSVYALAYDNLVSLHAAMASHAYKEALLLAGDAVKPEVRVVSALKSWPATDRTLMLAAAPKEPVLTTTPTTNNQKKTVAHPIVEPAPPITEPVKVARLAPRTLVNGQLAEVEKPQADVVAMNVKPGISESEELESLIRSWAKAWSHQEVRRYLSFYSDKFRPSTGISHKKWKRARELRISGKKRIEINITEFKFSIDGSTAKVLFRQAYHSDTFQDVVLKELILVREKNGWKIIGETIAG